MFVKRLLILLALFTVFAAACSDDEEKPRRTIEVVITNEPTIEAQQMTIEALQTQVALNVTATPTQIPVSATPTLTATVTAAPVEMGVVLVEGAVVLAEPDMDAEVLGELPLSAEVGITAQTEPNRIGIVFYSIEYENLTGWVASTQIQPAPEAAPTQAAIVPTEPQRPAATSTPLPTVTSPPTSTPTRTPTPLPAGFPTPEVY
ncbi:MAG: hypothetical protein K8I82_30990, partial [Anaerolineae bacterium]|nr:hypothetical protein [Anaerolineae bacterium]